MAIRDIDPDIEWRIYYADGTTWDADDGSYAKAPNEGVLFIVMKSGDRVEVLSGADYYALLDGDTIADTDDLASIVRNNIPWIKHGVWVSKKKMEAARAKVQADWGI